MIFILFSIMFVWSIALISLPNTYNCYLRVFYFYPLQMIKNEAAKIPITRSGIVICNYLSRTGSFWGKYRTPFRKVSAISWKYNFLGWIHISDFLVSLIICFHASFLSFEEGNSTRHASNKYKYWVKILMKLITQT